MGDVGRAFLRAKLTEGEFVYSNVIGIITDIFILFFFLLGAYYLGVAIFSFFPQRRIASDIKDRSFAVFIPAYNEARVLPDLLKSIKGADYPQELINVTVIADACSDNTREIAESFGARVIVRQSSSGKGDALSEVLSMPNNIDADCIAVFDADNVIDYRFFREINERFSSGEVAVQGYIDSKNPYSSWVSNAHSIWYWVTNRTVQAGRRKLSMGSRLGGTGFALKRELLEEIKWRTTTVAEDAEYTYMLAERGIKIDFCETAVVYDEKPELFSESVRQRKRWAKGVGEVQGEYTPRLLKKFRINALLGLWCDTLYPLSFMILLCAAVFRLGGIGKSALGLVCIWLCVLANILTSVWALILDKKMSKRVLPNTIGFLIYIISWVPIGIMGISSRDSAWSHTKHGAGKRL